jgi:hypothetical protein
MPRRTLRTLPRQLPDPTAPVTVGSLLPDLAVELSSLLMEANEPMLALDVPALPVVSWCGCGKAYCQTFYTAPEPDLELVDADPDRPGLRSVTFDDALGTIAVEVVDERITIVVVHDRPDLVPRLARDLTDRRP